MAQQLTNPGLILRVSLSAEPGGTEANLLIENVANGKELDEDFSLSDASSVAQGQTAEWVVERAAGETLMDFGTITFSEASAVTAKEVEVDLSGATALSISNSATDPTTIATGDILDTVSISVTYTGPRGR
ncbi:hypothetical protein BDZ45DRAFT_688095 [Acephala macrosclerotiorum]|nr:hypothetical protein BDZ45DRAFT_688095 [Acephala macrosclerotiorum]